VTNDAGSMPAAAPLRVAMRSVCKRFGGVQAVVDASVDLAPGEVVGLLGHNGAGKSTLMKLLSGALRPDSGEIWIDGREVRLRGPRDARANGIETLYQTLALADNLDATANLFLGRELRSRWGTLDEEAMEQATRQVLGGLNPRFNQIREPVRSLSGGQRQLIALARAIHFDARVLVMDEPTAALGPEERGMVLEWIRRLRERGLGIFVVSHELLDVLDVADRVVVMNNGRVVGSRRAAETNPDEIVELIVRGDASIREQETVE
jgi:D-xylose transport system ATP-binding protein